nr:DNA mismatch repair protein MLH3 isoform X4 [Ipomoea batatas]
MRSIAKLPEAVHSSIRSGIVLYDLTRVVEELVYNSLDAGANKVSVAVGVGTCYVKVVDNGYGVSRDGLELLGEKYATSKYDPLDDMNSVPLSFGYRGEALSSITDVSLVEIVTKAHGRPNGYRKVLKAGILNLFQLI